MARTNVIIDATVDEIERAKESAVALINDSNVTSSIELFYSNNLEEIEHGIKRINEFSNKAWILSAVLIFSLVYDKSLYRQSGMDWAEYSKQARERLGIDQRDISDQLAGARFFIKYHKQLELAGWQPNSSNRKLARAELALELSGDIDATINHLVNDTWMDFKAWYTTFKNRPAELPTDSMRKDITIDGNNFKINGVNAVTVSDSISKEDAEKLNGYLKTIFETLKQGYVPAIVSVYDEREANILPKLRDRYRQGR